jgi:hypothetical protein
MKFIAALQTVFNVVKNTLAMLGFSFDFGLNETQQAAAGFRVLTNELKETNKEIFALTKNSQQLNKAINDFQKLDRIAFKTPAQINQ